MKRFWSAPAIAINALLLIAGTAMLGHVPGAAAAACTSAGGNWATPATWSACGGLTPQAADTVTITAGTVTLNTNATVAGLTVNGGTLSFGSNTTVRTLTVNGNVTVAAGATVNVANFTATHVLAVSGDITNNGTLDLVRDGNSLCTLNFTGGATHTIGGTSAGTTEFSNVTVASNLIVNKTGGAIAQTGTLSVTGTLTLTAGTLNLANTTTVTGATSISGTLGHTTATGTRTFTGAVTINSGGTMSETAAAALAFGNNLIISGGGTLTEFGAATMSCAGNLQNDGTYTASTGVHTFTGAATSFSGVNPIVIPSVTVSAARTNNGTLTVNTALAGAGPLTNAATGILNIGGTSTITTLTATAANNTVNYTGAGAQTIKATIYDKLNTSGGGAKTISGATTINSTLAVVGGALTNSSTLTIAATAISVSGLTNGATGTLVIAGSPTITSLTASAVGNTVNYTGAAQTVAPTAYHHLGLSGSGAKTLTGVTTLGGNLTLSGTATATTTANFSIGGNLVVGTGTTFTSPNFTNSVAGTTSVTGTLAYTGVAAKTHVGLVTVNAGGVWNNSGNAPVNFRGGLTHSGTTFTAGSGIYSFTTNAQAIAGTLSIPSVTVTGVVLTNNGVLTVSTDLTGTGTLTMGTNRTLNIGNTVSVNTLNASTNAGNTVNYTGAAQNIKTTTYRNLGFGGSLAKTAVGALTVNGTTTWTGTATFTTGAFTHNFNGTWAINTPTAASPVLATGSTINFGTPTPAAATTIGGTTTGTIALNNVNVTNTSGVTQNDAMTIAGTLTVGAGATFTTANFTIVVTGATTVSGTRAHSGAAAKTYIGAVTINAGGNWTNAGNAAITYQNGITHNGTTFNTGTGTQTFNTNSQALAGSSAMTFGGVVAVVGAVTLTNNNTNAGGVTIAGNLTGSVAGSTFVNPLNRTLNYGGTLAPMATGVLTATANPNTVNYNSAGNQALKTTTYHHLGLSGSGSKTVAAAGVVANGTLTVTASAILAPVATAVISGATGTLTGTGTVQVTRIAATAGFSQQYTINTKTLTNLTVEYIGAAAQIVSTVAYGSLKINNASGVTLAADTTVGGTLSLTVGAVTAGAFTLTASANCPASVVVGTGYVNGRLRLNFPAGATTTCTYPVGTSATAYTPIVLTAVTGTGGLLTARSVAGDHPNIGTADVDATRTANRYWAIWATGDTIGLTSYSATFTFVPADVDGGATPTSFVADKYQGGAWSLPTTGTVTATTIEVTGVTGPLASTADFAAGETTALFAMSTPDALAGAVVAGRPHLLRLTRTNLGGTTLTGYTGAKNLDGWFTASGTHPGSATAPQICAANVGDTCLPATGGSCVTLPSSAPALNAGSNNLSITFASGVANFCLSTADVGQYTISLRDDSNIAQPVTGTSATLTARPYAIAVANIVQGAVVNPASSAANSSNPFVAGSNFSTTVTGYLWKSTGTGIFGMGDADGDGVPDSGATYADVVTNGGGNAPRYADSVTLATDTTLAANFVPNGAGTTQGSLSNGSVTVANGTGTATTLQYSEVGSFTLKATAATDYLGGGVDLNSRVVIFSDSTNRTAWVGRFRPDHFTITPASVGPGCGTFTYFGQDGFTTVFDLKAENAAGGTTTNYIGDGNSSGWAKLPLTTWTAAPASAGSPGFGFAVSLWSPSQPSGAALAASATAPTATDSNTWVAGATTVTAKHKIDRPTAAAVPTTVTVSALPVDSDGVTMAAAASAGATILRFGVLRMENAYGSELLALRVPVRAMYWTSSGWILNTGDSCTQIPNQRDSLALGNYKGTLTSGNYDSTKVPSAALTLSSGSGTIVLTKPNTGTSGSVDMAINLGATGGDVNCNGVGFPQATTGADQSWLRGKWCGSNYDKDPSARVRFGVPKAPYIYLRERY